MKISKFKLFSFFLYDDIINKDLNRFKDIKIENYIWIIYISMIILSWYANSKVKGFIINENDTSKKNIRL